jgi:hypothetical protein
MFTLPLTHGDRFDRQGAASSASRPNPLRGCYHAAWRRVHAVQQTSEGGTIVPGKHFLRKNGVWVSNAAWLLKLDANGNNPREPQLKGVTMARRVARY